MPYETTTRVITAESITHHRANVLFTPHDVLKFVEYGCDISERELQRQYTQ